MSSRADYRASTSRPLSARTLLLVAAYLAPQLTAACVSAKTGFTDFKFQLSYMPEEKEKEQQRERI